MTDHDKATPHEELLARHHKELGGFQETLSQERDIRSRHYQDWIELATTQAAALRDLQAKLEVEHKAREAHDEAMRLEGMILLRASFIEWLKGAAPHPDTGAWFDRPGGRKEAFWWRKELRAEIARRTSAQTQPNS